jgi:hypothetical protein
MWKTAAAAVKNSAKIVTPVNLAGRTLRRCDPGATMAAFAPADNFVAPRACVNHPEMATLAAAANQAGLDLAVVVAAAGHIVQLGPLWRRCISENRIRCRLVCTGGVNSGKLTPAILAPTAQPTKQSHQ